MIKQLSKHDLLVSPFTATKSWELYNIDNDETVLLEPLSASVLIADTNVSLDYIDYYGTPSLNRDCNIALEQQETDLAIFEAGISGSGIFKPVTEDKNQNGSYKRLVYNQVNRAFYNTYRNPLQIFGMENIDFPKSKTNRYIANEFIVFTVPQYIFGDRLLENSIHMYDNGFNDKVAINDDGNGNLMAGINLFSKIQEVRGFGNEIMEGTASYSCPTYHGLTWEKWTEIWGILTNNWETYMDL